MIAWDAPVRLGGRLVLHGDAFRARAGELVALVGPNGAGKSTLLRALAGLLPGAPRPDPRRLAWLPQGARCAWGLTVTEVAALGRIPHGDADAGAIEAAIVACGLSALRDARIDRLSGGQQRRAMLARVLAGAPAVLLLDEPTADLDPAAAHEIMALLRARATAGACVVAVLHDLALALHHATRIVVLAEGRITADAPPAEALPAAAAAFGLPHGIDPAPRLLPPRAGA
jgi:iron complex transport system ATP-binding protein